MRRAPGEEQVRHDIDRIDKNLLLFYLLPQLDGHPEAERCYDQLDLLVNISYQINGLH